MMRPFFPGVVVHFSLSEAQDVGLIASITELASSLRESYYGDSHELNCFVRYETDAGLAYCTVPGKSLKLGTPESLAAAPATRTVLSFRRLMETHEICREAVFGQEVFVYKAEYRQPEEYGPLGVPLSPMFLASINHRFTLQYLRMLAHQLQQNPHTEALQEMWRQLTLCVYSDAFELPRPAETFTSRTPGVANYSAKGHDVLGNFWVSEYSSCYNSCGVEVSVGSICRVSGAEQPVRVDRILEMGTGGGAGPCQLHFYGIAFLPGRHDADAVVPCIHPVTALEEVLDAETHDLNKVFPIDADTYNVWTLVTAEQIQEGNRYIATIDAQLGFNFTSALDVYLSPGDSEMTYATPVECALASYLYIQGQICHLSTGVPVVSWKPGRNGCFAIAEATPATFEQLQQHYSDTLLLLDKDPWLYTPPCAYHYSKASEQPLDALLQLSQHVLASTSAIASSREMRCCYCARPVEAKDKVAGPFVFGLTKCRDPLFLAQYVAPILVVAHHTCAFYTPEIAFLPDKDLKQEHLRIRPEKRFDLIVEGDVPLIVRATALDRVLRALLTEFSPSLYLNVRKTFKKSRMELVCSVCGEPGALIGCYNKDCQFTAHYHCVIGKNLKVTEKRAVYCKRHS